MSYLFCLTKLFTLTSLCLCKTDIINPILICDMVNSKRRPNERISPHVRYYYSQPHVRRILNDAVGTELRSLIMIIIHKMTNASDLTQEKPELISG